MNPTFLIEFDGDDVVLRSFENAQVFTTIENLSAKDRKRLARFLAEFEPGYVEPEDDGEPSQADIEDAAERAAAGRWNGREPSVYATPFEGGREEAR